MDVEQNRKEILTGGTSSGKRHIGLGMAGLAVIGLVVVLEEGCGSTQSSTSAPTLAPNSSAPNFYDRVTAGIWIQAHMPLTQTEAISAKWTLVEKECDWRWGYRYRLGERLTPTLLYNNVGDLVGMQILVNSTEFPLYPLSNLRIGEEIIMVNGEEAGHTLLFKDPTNLCNSSPDNRTAGTADRLWVLTGNTTKGEYENIPLELPTKDGDVTLPQGYVSGGCAATGFIPNTIPGMEHDPSPGMGVHYWRNLSGPLGINLAAEDMGPMFLLYDKNGKLRAFGFTYVGKEGRVPTVGGARPVPSPLNGSWIMNNTELWEFAQQPLVPPFFQQGEMPICLNNLNTWNASLPNGTITTGTLHVFVSDPFSIECPAPAMG